MFRLLALIAVLALAGCDDQSAGPYVEIVGGGFIFNYRVADTYYGLVATALRPVPAGTRLVAEFEDPAGGPPLTVAATARDGQTRFVLDSPPVKGVVAGQPYTVVLRLETPQGETIETHEKPFRSNVDQSVMPDKPLTIGPGYAKNPEAQ